jgi:acyl-CoA thioester hydrolase
MTMESSPMSLLNQEYHIVLTQDVIWGDMDAFQHVNNTVYLRYFETARIAWFEKIGANAHKVQTGIGPILASIQCNYRLPLEYPDRIQIACRGRILSPKKVNTEYLVISEKHRAVAAEGEGLLVYYDYNNNRSCEIPKVIVAAIESPVR